ncbi:MAG: MerR family transcriptional regulator [Verrucomicrobiales bacterium]|nr:MerR family transcriptional regulator [Verrucomicrobiales bacterium]
MSSVSVRTLHWYDEVGLLKPAYHGPNGYRFYEEAQLLTLQQILFYRELGFELQQIKRILGRSDFDKVTALKSHREVLCKNLARTRQLIVTIDKTIRHLKGTKNMKTEEMFAGFDPQQQARHEQYLIDRYGADMKESIAQSKARVKNWTKGQWEKSGTAFGQICRDLVALMGRGLSPDSREAQQVIRRHYEWLKQFWTPDRESYVGHGQLIADSELRQAYEKYHPALPEFAAASIKRFAERELA